MMIPPLAGLQAEFGADTSSLDIECSLVDIHQQSGVRVQGKMILLQNHFVQNELPQFIFIECWILDIIDDGSWMAYARVLRVGVLRPHDPAADGIVGE